MGNGHSQTTWRDFQRWRKKSRREWISNAGVAVVGFVVDAVVVAVVVAIVAVAVVAVSDDVAAFVAAVVAFPALSSLLLTRRRRWARLMKLLTRDCRKRRRKSPRRRSRCRRPGDV